MAKIKITEKQALKLGLVNIKENDDSGLKSINSLLGANYVTIVIEGPNVGKNKDFILSHTKKFDTTNTLNFFEATNKIVGKVDVKKLKAITSELTKFDPSIVVKKKAAITENKKSIVKITKEQYNRIFAGKLNETMNSVDKTFKKNFAGKDIENLKEVGFNISKPNTSIPASAQGKFGVDLMEGGEDLKKETIELIKYLYRKSDKLSPFWAENNISYNDIYDTLKSKNIIIDKDGKYELSKSLGTPEKAIEKLQAELQTLLSGGDTSKKQIETESSNYPAGAEYDPRAPYNKSDDATSPIEPSNKQLKVIAFNRDIAILKSNSGDLFLFEYNNVEREDYEQYASIMRTYIGKDEDGFPDYSYDDEFEITDDVVSNYINDNIKTLSIGEGYDDWLDGYDLIKIDDSLKQELLNTYDKDKKIISVLGGGIKENEENEENEENIEMLKKSINDPNKERINFSKEDIAKKLADLRTQELVRRGKGVEEEMYETTSAASSGSFTGPMTTEPIKKTLPVNNLNVPVISENDDIYTHYAIMKNTNKIVDGWEYNGLDRDEIKHWTSIDLKDNFPDNKLSDFRVMSKKNLSKYGLNPNNTEDWFKLGLSETTSGSGSMGAYDANALPGIGRDGNFKKPSMTNAQKKTQYAGGSFVDFNDCTKFNNKSAGSGCSQGAVDNVVKLKKTSGNINAPSLS
jgi:hypothetical protein